jgi:hypothetical protein
MDNKRNTTRTEPEMYKMKPERQSYHIRKRQFASASKVSDLSRSGSWKYAAQAAKQPEHEVAEVSWLDEKT